jgi:hypothetical protein
MEPTQHVQLILIAKFHKDKKIKNYFPKDEETVGSGDIW